MWMTPNDNNKENDFLERFADDVGILFCSCQSIFTYVLGMKHAAAQIVPKLLIWAKTTSHGHCVGDVNDVQSRSRFTQKGHNLWLIMDVWLRHWNQSSINPMKASRRATINKKKGRMYANITEKMRTYTTHKVWK